MQGQIDSPPQFPYVSPPAPLGQPGGKAGGFTSSGKTNTELGDAVETAVVQQLGFEGLLGDRRQGAFDVACGDWVFEVKAVTRQAAEYKAKPKKAELERKRAAAEALGMSAAMMIVVVDGDAGWCYWREGLGAYRLSDKFAFAGQIEL